MSEQSQPDSNLNHEAGTYGREAGFPAPSFNHISPDHQEANSELNHPLPQPYSNHPEIYSASVPDPSNPSPNQAHSDPSHNTPNFNQSPLPSSSNNSEPVPPTPSSDPSELYPPHIRTHAELGEHPVVKSGKTAFFDVTRVLKRLIKDPITGLPTVLTALGDSRTLNAGILLGCAFIVTSWWSLWRVSYILSNLLSFSLASFFSRSAVIPDLRMIDHLKIILFSSLPLLILLGILIAIQKIFKKQVNVKQMVFVTAISVFPFTILQLLLTLFGAGNLELVAILLVFSVTTFIVTIHTSLIYVLRLTARASLMLVPTILLAFFYIQKFLLETILST